MQGFETDKAVILRINGSDEGADKYNGSSKEELHSQYLCDSNKNFKGATEIEEGSNLNDFGSFVSSIYTLAVEVLVFSNDNRHAK